MREWSATRKTVALILFFAAVLLVRQFLVGIQHWMAPDATDLVSVSKFVAFGAAFVLCLFAIGYYVDRKNGLR